MKAVFGTRQSLNRKGEQPMRRHTCRAGCCHSGRPSRREFLGAASASVVSATLVSCGLSAAAPAARAERKGPASRCVPTIKACFVRRKADYGMAWPGAVYDGEI